MKQHFQLMANYNKNMNQKLLELGAGIPEEVLIEDMGAFFGSIFKTFNHILLGDLIWLSRFSGHQSSFASIQKYSDFKFQSLNDQLSENFSEFKQKRIEVDKAIESMGQEISDADLDMNLRFTSTSGKVFERPLWIYTTHFFNHQTHHRGQITTMLKQKGFDPGVTDLPAVIS